MTPPDRPKRPKDADLLEWVEGVADAGSAGRVARAVTADPALRAELEAMAADRSSIRALIRDGVAGGALAPDDLVERIEASLERDALLDAEPAPILHASGRRSRSHRPGGRGLRVRERWAAPLVAATVLIASGGLLLWQPFSSPAPAPVEELAAATPSPAVDTMEMLAVIEPETAPQPTDDNAEDAALVALAEELEAFLGPEVEPNVVAASARAAAPVGPAVLPRPSPARAAELAAMGRLALVVTTTRPVAARLALTDAAERDLRIRSVPGLAIRGELPSDALAGLPERLRPQALRDAARADDIAPGVLAQRDGAGTQSPALLPVLPFALDVIEVPGATGYAAELRAEPRAVGSLRVWLIGQTNARVEFAELATPVSLSPRPEPGAALRTPEPDAAPRVAIPIVIVRPELQPE